MNTQENAPRMTDDQWQQWMDRKRVQDMFVNKILPALEEKEKRNADH